MWNVPRLPQPWCACQGKFGSILGNILVLDQVVSATFCHIEKWTPELTRNHSPYLLRFLLCRLWDEGQGKLLNTQIILAQGTLARKLGISRQWVFTLCQRLQEAGWIEYTAPFVAGGMRASCTFRIGRTLKRLLVMLQKYKTLKKSLINNRWKFSPSKLVKETLLILQKQKERENKPPTKEQCARIPLLNTWMDRGLAT